MKKIVSLLLVLVLAMSLPLSAMADRVISSSSWSLPSNSILRFLSMAASRTTTYSWVRDSKSRAILVGAAMMDIAKNEERFNLSTAAIDNGHVFVGYNPDEIRLFFYSPNGEVHIVFQLSTMSLFCYAEETAEYSDTNAITRIMSSAISGGIISEYWEVDKDSAMYGILYALEIADSLGWDQ